MAYLTRNCSHRVPCTGSGDAGPQMILLLSMTLFDHKDDACTAACHNKVPSEVAPATASIYAGSSINMRTFLHTVTNFIVSSEVFAPQLD